MDDVLGWEWLEEPWVHIFISGDISLQGWLFLYQICLQRKDWLGLLSGDFNILVGDVLVCIPIVLVSLIIVSLVLESLAQILNKRMVFSESAFLHRLYSLFTTRSPMFKCESLVASTLQIAAVSAGQESIVQQRRKISKSLSGVVVNAPLIDLFVDQLVVSSQLAMLRPSQATHRSSISESTHVESLSCGTTIFLGANFLRHLGLDCRRHSVNEVQITDQGVQSADGFHLKTIHLRRDGQRHMFQIIDRETIRAQQESSFLISQALEFIGCVMADAVVCTLVLQQDLGSAIAADL